MIHFSKSYKTFLTLSFFMHILAAELLHQFYHPQDHLHSLFSHTISARLQMSNVAKLPRLKTKSSKLMTSPAVPQEASTSEKNKEDLIPTDAPETAPHSEIIETVKHNYLRQVTQAIYRKKHYPRQAWALNQEGSVLVKLRLNKKGKILGLEVLEKAPFKTLTEASLETIKSITKFPPIPDELGMEEITFRIPIEYKINI